jgi:hypothetical protein
MLVCYSIVTAIRTRADEYATPAPESLQKKLAARKMTSDFSTYSSETKRHIVTMMEEDQGRISVLITAPNRSLKHNRELCGRTIRVEEMTNLIALCEEVEDLVARMSSNKRHKPNTSYY